MLNQEEKGFILIHRKQREKRMVQQDQSTPFWNKTKLKHVFQLKIGMDFLGKQTQPIW